MVETEDNMEDKTSSTSMALAKYHPMLDENKKSADEKSPVKSIIEEEKEEEEELKSSPIK